MPSPARVERALAPSLAPLALCALVSACGAPALVERPPSGAGDRGPPGTLGVRFLPARAGEEWQIIVGNRELCTAPCDRWVDPTLPYAFRLDPGPSRRHQFIEIPDLRPYEQYERVAVRAEGRSTAELVVGIVATSLGGLGVVTGATLTAVGAGLGESKGGGLYKAGVITLPPSALLVAGGVYLMVDSKGTARIEPMAAGPSF